MRKLILTCLCGQRMKLPRSAIGKKGLCPSCNREVDITASEARPENSGKAPKFYNPGPAPQSGQAGSQRFSLMEAKQAFGRATDLFFERHYGEALSIFDSIACEYPDSPEIEDARRQCVVAMRRPPLAITQEPSAAPLALTGPQDKASVKDAVITKLMEKMQVGASDEIQLRAAELIVRMMGLFDDDQDGQGAGDAKNDDAVDLEGNLDEVEDRPIPSNVQQMPRREQR